MNVYRDRAGRYAIEVDDNPLYRRLLTVDDGGEVDVMKIRPGVYSDRKFVLVSDPHAVGKFARTYASSTLRKTARAARIIQELIMTDLTSMSMAELVGEYSRLTGKTIKKFESKAAGVAAIKKASALKNVTAEPTAPAVGGASTEGSEMATKKAKAKPAKAAPKASKTKPKELTKEQVERAKRVANTTSGAGGLIVSLLKEKKLDNEAILSKALKAFPDNATQLSHVNWYRSMLRKAGVKV